MASYAQWVVKSHDLSDPNNMDVRIEPKFFLPDGPVFDQGWCRPQNDGPGLRAISLIQYATKQGAASSEVTQYLWTGDESKYHGGAI
jgi:glucoamylase